MEGGANPPLVGAACAEKREGGEVDFQLETSDTDRKMRLACKKKVIEEI